MGLVDIKALKSVTSLFLLGENGRAEPIAVVIDGAGGQAE